MERESASVPCLPIVSIDTDAQLSPFVTPRGLPTVYHPQLETAFRTLELASELDQKETEIGYARSEISKTWELASRIGLLQAELEEQKRLSQQTEIMSTFRTLEFKSTLEEQEALVDYLGAVSSSAVEVMLHSEESYKCLIVR